MVSMTRRIVDIRFPSLMHKRRLRKSYVISANHTYNFLQIWAAYRKDRPYDEITASTICDLVAEVFPEVDRDEVGLVATSNVGSPSSSHAIAPPADAEETAQSQTPAPTRSGLSASDRRAQGVKLSSARLGARGPNQFRPSPSRIPSSAKVSPASSRRLPWQEDEQAVSIRKSAVADVETSEATALLPVALLSSTNGSFAKKSAIKRSINSAASSPTSEGAGTVQFRSQRRIESRASSEYRMDEFAAYVRNLKKLKTKSFEQAQYPKAKMQLNVLSWNL